MANEGEFERTTVRRTPAGREEVREVQGTTRSTGAAGWWISAIVAIVAVVGLIFVFTSQNRADQLQAAREQGAAQANLDNAAAAAQQSAAQASQAAQAAVDSTARASQRAAEAAQAAANQTVRQAQAAGDAAQNASTTEPDAAPASPAQPQ
jgi:hypothetical protein